MARAFILSHGERNQEDWDTFVPDGSTISFYSDFDEATQRSIGLAALSAGDVEPFDTYDGGQLIPNYVLSAFEDSALAEHMTTESSATGAKPYYVGIDLPDPVQLCSDPEECQKTYPQHADSCEGVFGKVAEDEILSVSCRVLSGDDDAGATDVMEGSTDFMDELREEANRIQAWLASDPQAAIAYWESLTDATKVQLTGVNVDLEEDVAAYYDAGGESTPRAVLQARQYLADAGEGSFYDWVAGLDAKQQEFILGETDLEAAFEREKARRNKSITWDEVDWGFVQNLNQRLLKDCDKGGSLPFWQAGAGLLLGTEQPPTYRRLFEQLRGNADGDGEAPSGTVTVLSRGSGLSHGEVEVTGDYDEEAFKQALRQFSQKKVTFA
jgi:putative adhesin Stv-like protein